MAFRKIILMLTGILLSVSCSGEQKKEVKNNQAMNGSKVLIVFFSHAGENYSVGNVKVGNTKLVADEIKKRTGGDEFEIVAEKSYDMPYSQLIEIAKEETKTMAWGPLGGEGADGVINSELLAAIGQKYGKSAAQVALRWLIQRGIVAIPKSSHIERMQQNFNVFGFKLTPDDMAQIETMNQSDAGFINFGDPSFVKYLLETYG